MLPLFDSLTHPTITGRGIDEKSDATFERLSADLKSAHYIGACAVGIAGVQQYNHQAFLQACKSFPELVPVAGLDPCNSKDSELDVIKELGFIGIKIHPRLSQLPLSSQILGGAFQSASAKDLTVFYCTYLHSPLPTYPEEDPFFVLVKALKMAPRARVVLLHGGDIQLLRYAELARFNENLLLDLSFTMMKYKESSLEYDLRYLFQNMDRRICIGSDHPEYQHTEVRLRFEQLAKNLPRDKQENIAFKNILNFLRLPLSLVPAPDPKE